VSDAPAAPRTATLAGLATLPFLLLWLFDGFWKAKLVQAAPLAFWAIDLFEWVIVPAASLFFLHRCASISKNDYGLGSGIGSWKAIALFLPCFVTLFIADDWGTLILGRRLFGDAPGAFRMDLALQALGPLADAGVLYLSATAAVGESLFVLGLPWLWLSQGEKVSRGGAFAFALVSALIFALAHWETGLANMTGAFLFQLLAVWWYFRLKTLWPIIASHFLIDLYFFGSKLG
jgi:membrane protease YdiL (CAAX protease family)